MSLARICRWFGVTRQAYYQACWRQEERSLEHQLVLNEVRRIRSDHKRMGTIKLHEKLEPIFMDLHIKMGRDGLNNLLRQHGMLIRNKRRKYITTNSLHRYKMYPNLIRDLKPTGANQIWVSDITYWKPKNTVYYISFITDLYSHKVVGYHIATTLEAEASAKALKMALRENPRRLRKDLIHHSDRGSQYCSDLYTKILKAQEIEISMTENGDPLENAVAERINGIIKGEYLFDKKPKNLTESRTQLQIAIELYNTDRPHLSIGNLYPAQLHASALERATIRMWKNYYKKRSDVNLKQEQNGSVNKNQE